MNGMPANKWYALSASERHDLRKKPFRDEMVAAELKRNGGARVREINLAIDGFTARICNLLRYKGVRSLDEAVTLYDAELLRLPNFGRSSLKVFRASVERSGFELCGDGRLVSVSHWGIVSYANAA